MPNKTIVVNSFKPRGWLHLPPINQVMKMNADQFLQASRYSQTIQLIPNLDLYVLLLKTPSRTCSVGPSS